MNEKPKTAALVAKADQIQTLVDGVLVKNTPEELEKAADVVKSIKVYKNEVADFFKTMKENAYRSWKAICAREKEFLDPGDKAEKAIKLKISRYYEWERAEKAKEYKAQMEEARKAAEAKRLAEMEQLEETGSVDEAEHLANQPLDIAPPAPPQETKADGLSTSERWSAEVVDKAELLKFCAGDKRWQHLVEPVMKELNKLAVAQKGTFDIPGCKANKEIGVSVRT